MQKGPQRPTGTQASSWPCMVIRVVDNNTDSGCSRATDLNTAPGCNVGSDVIMTLGGREGHSDLSGP